ncbi:ribonuclease H-like domain-containing protein [Mycena galericulata]|nr:ribonuclease H-like domain-containing protein [Mycena galericulata]
MVYRLDVWADGACRGNGQPGSIAGAGVWFSRPLNGSRGWSRPLPRFPTPTNQRAELSAIIMALEMARDRRAELRDDPFFILTIHADSKYAIGCLSEWLDKWLNNGWRNARGFEVANRELIEEASDLMDDINNGGRVDFVWVPREENENADYLANKACDELEEEEY